MGVDQRRFLRKGSVSGFTLIEVLVASTILIVVLGIVAAYFGQQARVSRETQTRSEAQNRARLVMQLVSQDLSQTGAMKYLLDGGVVSGASLATCPDYTDPASGHVIATCLRLDNHGSQDSLSLLYVNSLRSQSVACRGVAYRFSGNTLLRYDQPCGSPFALVDPTSASNFDPVASDVLAVDVGLACSNSSTTGISLASYPNETQCPYDSAYPRSATVTVVTESSTDVPGSPQRTIATATKGSVTCPASRFCYEITQQVLLPNLKGN